MESKAKITHREIKIILNLLQEERKKKIDIRASEYINILVLMWEKIRDDSHNTGDFEFTLGDFTDGEEYFFVRCLSYIFPDIGREGVRYIFYGEHYPEDYEEEEDEEVNREEEE